MLGDSSIPQMGRKKSGRDVIITLGAVGITFVTFSVTTATTAKKAGKHEWPDALEEKDVDFRNNLLASTSELHQWQLQV